MRKSSGVFKNTCRGPSDLLPKVLEEGSAWLDGFGKVRQTSDVGRSYEPLFQSLGI